MRLTGNRYSFIAREVASKVSQLESGEIGIGSIRSILTKELSMAARKGVPMVVDKAGRTLDVVNYSEMSIRANYKQTFQTAQNNRYDEYGIDLVTSNVLADSSAICSP